MIAAIAGLTTIGVLCAVLLGGALAWAGPTGYLVVGALLWAAGPTHDVEAALCAGTVFIVGLALVTVRGTRDRVREPS